MSLEASVTILTTTETSLVTVYQTAQILNDLTTRTLNNDPDDTNSNPIILFVWFTFKLLHSIVYSFIYVLQKLFSSLLLFTFQITFSSHSLIYLFLIISTPLYAYIRYTYLTNYSRLPKESKRQNPTLDTFLNSDEDNQTGQVKSYLDKFLSAIKIFGYLDTPVFHELTKSLQTQKIDSGEIIFLDECEGFSICVEGDIQVYSKISDSTSSSPENQQHKDLFDKLDNHNVVVVDGVKYQLLNIIKSGAPLSSFIQVLNLLTDSQLNLSSVTPTPNFNYQRNLPALPVDNFSLDQPLPTASPMFYPVKGSPSPCPSPSKLIAIPKNNCTISMIPKESFTRIAAKYPKDTSHIIQMILTKLYRVTFQTAHNFLDLTPNIFQTEINLNNTQKPNEKKIPKYLQNSAIRYIENLDNLTDKGALENNNNNAENDNNNNSYRQKNNFQNSNINLNNGSYSPTATTNKDSPISSASLSTSSSAIYLTTKSKKKPRNSNLSSKNLSTLKYQYNYNSSTSSTSNYADLLTSDGDDSVLLTDTPSLNDKKEPFSSTTDVSNALTNLKKKSKSRHFVLDNRTTTNPGDLLSNVPLPRNSEFKLNRKISQLDIDDLKDRTFSADDEESEESTLRSALAEKIAKLIGLDKNNFSVDNYRSNSMSNTLIHSPMLNSSNIKAGIRYVTNVNEQNTPSRYNKLRTYSTTSMEGLVNSSTNGSFNNINAVDESSSINSDVHKSYVNFENVRKEFADDIKLLKVSKDTKIIKSKEQTPGIYYVIDGSFDVTYWKRESEFIGTYISEPENSDNTKEKAIEEYLYTVKNGEIAGYLGTLIGSKSFVDVTATRDSYVAFLSREFFEFLTERYPKLELGIARLLLKVLDKKLYLTDYALEWVHSSAGEVLYKQSDPANGIYVVLNGRLRALSKNKDDTNYLILGEYGQGESMGEIEVLTKSKRLNTVVSIRDSELARIPRTLFELIALINPSIMVNISRIVANRVKMDGVLLASHSMSSATASTRIRDEPMVQSFDNYRTLTLLPVSHNSVPLTEFAEKLANALEKVGKTVKILNQSAALSNLGKYAFDKLAKMKQGGYFSELEEKYDIIIYLCDAVVNSTWTSTCIQQGDCIILLADSMSSPDVGEYERLLVKSKTTARTELVLLHPERHIEPGSTHKWLKNRIWVHSHHHIQMQYKSNKCTNDNNQVDNFLLMGKKLTNNIMFKMETIVNNNDFLQFLKQTKEDFRSKKYYQPLQEHKDDFMRLARLLTGQAIGLVLGGGGARGISHVGVIKALEDKGIPVDIVGGTSIGAFVGGLYAKEYDFVPVYGRAKIFAGRMSSIWRSLLDLTIPLTSYLTGHEFNRGIWKAFGDSRIEDFWIKYYTNSTNLTDSVMEIHTSGYAWRYVRASMTLASLLPPLTDDGNMLLDGGYIDNLTVTEMQRRGAKHIIAVDVGSVDDRSPMNYGNTLSGWWVLLNRMNPFSAHANVPTMADIQMRLAYVASVNALERAKNSKGCSYLRPPIEGYATLAFGKFQEIYDVGVEYGNEQLKEIVKTLDVGTKKKQVLPGKRNRRRYSL